MFKTYKHIHGTNFVTFNGYYIEKMTLLSYTNIPQSNSRHS